jgi:hypothetical protein
MRLDGETVRKPSGKIDYHQTAKADIEAARQTIKAAFSQDSATIPIVRVLRDIFEMAQLPGATIDVLQAAVAEALGDIEDNLHLIDGELVRDADGGIDHYATADANMAAAKQIVELALHGDSSTIPIVRNLRRAFGVAQLPHAAVDVFQAGVDKVIGKLQGE